MFGSSSQFYLCSLSFVQFGSDRLFVSVGFIFIFYFTLFGSFDFCFGIFWIMFYSVLLVSFKLSQLLYTVLTDCIQLGSIWFYLFLIDFYLVLASSFFVC